MIEASRHQITRIRHGCLHICTNERSMSTNPSTCEEKLQNTKPSFHVVFLTLSSMKARGTDMSRGQALSFETLYLLGALVGDEHGLALRQELRRPVCRRD